MTMWNSSFIRDFLSSRCRSDANLARSVKEHTLGVKVGHADFSHGCGVHRCIICDLIPVQSQRHQGSGDLMRTARPSDFAAVELVKPAVLGPYREAASASRLVLVKLRRIPIPSSATAIRTRLRAGKN